MSSFTKKTSSSSPLPATFSLSDVEFLNLPSPNLTASLASQIIALYPIPSLHTDPSSHEMLKSGVHSATPPLLPHSPVPPVPHIDLRPPPTPAPHPPLVHTDYPLAQTLPSLTFTPTPSLATHHFHLSQCKNFLTREQYINQFPYEAALIRKDMLPLTVRAHAYGIPGDHGTSPSWWLQCFDCTTEFHLLTAAHEATDGCVWVVKPSQGTHSEGGRVCVSLAGVAEFLREMRGCDLKKEFVAQECVVAPLCVGGRKFDLRVWVFVRRFDTEDFEAYMSGFYHARVADGAWEGGKSLQDETRFYTVGSTYKSGGHGELMGPEKLKECLSEQGNTGVDWEGVMGKMGTMCGELFRAGGKVVGKWPRSRAYYGIDVIVTADGTPKLVEVNYQGDFEGPKHVAENCGEPEFYEMWKEDLVKCLFTEEEVEDGKRLIKL